MELGAAIDRAQRLHDMGNPHAAIEAWRDVLSQDPLIAEAHAGLAASLFAARRLVGAEAEAKEALRLDHENIEAMLTMVLLAQLQNRPAKALARIDHVLTVAPWSIEAKVLRATLLRLQGRKAEAAEAIDEVLELAPNDHEVLIEAGWQARDRSDYAAVDALAQSVLARDPDRVSALVLMGYARRDCGQGQEALELALAALESDPCDPEALELLATVKVSRNPLIGMVWHAMRLLARLGEWPRIFLLVGVYFLYMATLTTFAWFDWPEWISWLFIAVYLAFGLATWAIPALVGWMVRRELRQVRLSPRY